MSIITSPIDFLHWRRKGFIRIELVGKRQVEWRWRWRWCYVRIYALNFSITWDTFLYRSSFYEQQLQEYNTELRSTWMVQTSFRISIFQTFIIKALSFPIFHATETERVPHTVLFIFHIITQMSTTETDFCERSCGTIYYFSTFFDYLRFNYKLLVQEKK